MATQPQITVSSLDADRIDKLLDSLDERELQSGHELLAELDRAVIVAPEEIPADVVTMNSSIKFRETSSGREFSLTLVYPQDSGKNNDAVSILAPVGSALLGLKEGDTIEWPKPGGGVLSVQIIEVSFQPERAGEYHR